MAGILHLLVFIGITGLVHGQFNPRTPTDLPMSPASFAKSPSSPAFVPKSADNKLFQLRSELDIPFPQCIETEAASMLLQPDSINRLYLAKIQQEDGKLEHERDRNDKIPNNDMMDFEATQLRSDSLNGALLARAATRLSEDILKQLRCETNASVTEHLDDFLRTIQLPANFCAFKSTANCNGLMKYRTVSGVCNNLARPYEGSSQTAFARLLPAAYDDGLSAPRSQSVLGGPLPACREISLAMGSEPVFDQSYNNMFVTYGQFLIHDITLATPVTDSGRTPITSCSCSSQDSSMCTVIEISPNDPVMGGQRCMSIPATAEAFSDQTCALGVKDQLNGNSHYIDLSATYGSTKTTAKGLRTHFHGLVKTSKQAWSKFDLPPGQREGKSCLDSTTTQKCFAGGDSRLMENILLSAIQTQWVRAHNNFANEMQKIHPEWQNDDETLYEETKKILSALHQRYIYENWVPILIGETAARQYLDGDRSVNTQYDPNLSGVVFNEAATSVLRLHTLVRDLFTRCRPNGEFIDQVWLHDISAKCKLAYDAANNGVDSLICGALYDFGFAGDTNYAKEIHHHLFETSTQGRMKRHDIVAINVCRGREHGIDGYNTYRQLCGLRRATQFEDFGDTMSMAAVNKLKAIYKHPDDVDLFIGTNHENHVAGGIVGPVSACIIGLQMKHLKYGDRFFYTHQGQFTPEQMRSIKSYSYTCFICHTSDIEKVPRNPFRPPNDQTNPLELCSQCLPFDFNPWRTASNVMG